MNVSARRILKRADEFEQKVSNSRKFSGLKINCQRVLYVNNIVIYL
jgi:hypothetical protein